MIKSIKVRSAHAIIEDMKKAMPSLMDISEGSISSSLLQVIALQLESIEFHIFESLNDLNLVSINENGEMEKVYFKRDFDEIKIKTGLLLTKPNAPWKF